MHGEHTRPPMLFSYKQKGSYMCNSKKYEKCIRLFLFSLLSSWPDFGKVFSEAVKNLVRIDTSDLKSKWSPLTNLNRFKLLELFLATGVPYIMTKILKYDNLYLS